MRPAAPSVLGLLVLLTAFPGAAGGEAPPEGASGERRWLPEACVVLLDGEPSESTGGDLGEGSAEARWNRLYRSGIDAIQDGDLAAAEIDFCRALAAARAFAPADIRFAETLDELGLVNYLIGDDEGAEAMQGAAAAEMLLALGPPAEDLAAAAAESCRSSVAIYMTRLGWIFERQGRREEIRPLMQQPYRVLERGYLPTDSLLGRLDGLISRYLLREDFAAADRLSALRERLHESAARDPR